MTAPAQQSLLTWTPPQPSPRASEQERELARVERRGVALAVLNFCRLHTGETFSGADLAAYVLARCGGSPSSADRVLRALRAEGVIDVELVSRSASLYRVVRVSP